MFAAKPAEKNRKNWQKERISRRLPKSRRVGYLDNKLTEVKKIITPLNSSRQYASFDILQDYIRSILKNDLI